jgi:hypothetical protein
MESFFAFLPNPTIVTNEFDGYTLSVSSAGPNLVACVEDLVFHLIFICEDRRFVYWLGRETHQLRGNKTNEEVRGFS